MSLPDGSMSEETVEIQWAYTPVDFFDEKIDRDCGEYTVEIDGGLITARMSADFYKPGLDFRRALTEELNNYFLLWQLDRRKTFEIRDGSVVRIHPNGTRDISIVVSSVVCVSEVGTPNLITTDANGVVHDARREHFEAMKKLVELRLRHASDRKAHRMLESHAGSISTPGEELVYLYEIWDALKKKFQGPEKARSVLNISPETLTRFNELTCNLPLKQGRHRGKFDTLRDATAEELVEARRIAQDMMERYLRHLDDQR